jgi:domain of unknown function (DUF1771)
MRNQDLDALKTREQEAFSFKQNAWKKYDEARTRCSELHNAMQSAWNERVSARDVMNHEYEAMQNDNNNYRAVWDEYGRIRDYNNAEIESLRNEADYEHREMIRCFDQASSCYQYGDKSEAPYWSEQGHSHKNLRDGLNCRISKLCREVKAAKQNAEIRANKTNSSAFHRAKETFNDAKNKHEAFQASFKQLKAERDQLKLEFNRAEAEHRKLKEQFKRKLDEIKTNSKREREETLDKAEVSLFERSDAKIVKKSDGTTQIYHGGVGSGDGYGHGHTALDQFGNKTYDRRAFTEHGKQNYVDNEKRDYNSYSEYRNTALKNRPSHGGWTSLERGVIFDSNNRTYDVTFRQGLGHNDGQTLISDGHISGKKFNEHHSHYGNNNKSRFPNEPNRIEDSSRHKNDDSYSGPGH